ncbi:MAG: M50 family metallopeptidase [Dehalococcoidales bacterium]|nr:M50 family metallopeptidase [Dehalococcoidales bacterium]
MEKLRTALSGLGWPRLSRRESGYLIFYTLAVLGALVILHESAHIFTAMALGVPFHELKIGFFGINPFVRLPAWFTGSRQIIVHLAGGTVSGAVFLLLYLLLWMPRYRRRPSLFTWLLGAVSFMFSAMQFATGFLEGCYHAAYVLGSRILLSPTDILTLGWAVAAVFFHSSLCPLKRMKDYRAT